MATLTAKLFGKAQTENCAVRVEPAGHRLTNSNKPRETAATDDRLVTSGSLQSFMDEWSYEMKLVAGVIEMACRESCRVYSGRSGVTGTDDISGITVKFTR